MKTATPEDLAIASDYAQAHGLLDGPAAQGERVLLYTPTFIVAGLVSRVGPTTIEIIDAKVVFDTGELVDAARGNFKDASAWPDAIRVPISAVCLCQVMPTSAPTAAKGSKAPKGRR